MALANRADARGSLYLVCEVVVPTALTDAQRAALEAYRTLRGG
jgi:DnaJ-class molecular chaperone